MTAEWSAGQSVHRPSVDAGTPPSSEASSAVGHGSIHLIENKCTSCMICARECPTWCITIDSHSEELPEPTTGTSGARHPSRSRVRTHQVLDSFDIDFSLCMYCGICIEECPFDALEWAGPHVLGADSVAGLVHDRHDLAPPEGAAAAPTVDPEGDDE